MPLHDWTSLAGWSGQHIFWMTEIVRDLQAHLPPGYRAMIGASPLVAFDVQAAPPDVADAQWPEAPTPEASAMGPEPDVEVAVATLEEEVSVVVVRDGRMVAAIELISPRNKDRPTARQNYATRYLSYLRNGVHLLLVDVFRRPLGFSFPQLIAAELDEALPAPVTPSIVSYRVGEPAAQGGRLLAVWQQTLAIGAALPSMPLALTHQTNVHVDLEGTYQRAALVNYTGQ